MVKFSLFKKSPQSHKQSKSKLAAKKGGAGPGASANGGAVGGGGENGGAAGSPQQQQQQQQPQAQNNLGLGASGNGLTAMIETPASPAQSGGGGGGGAGGPPQLPNSSPPPSPTPSDEPLPTSLMPTAADGYANINMGLEGMANGASNYGQANGANGGTNGGGGQLEDSVDGEEAVKSLLDAARLAGEADQQLTGSLHVKPPRLTHPPPPDVGAPSTSYEAPPPPPPLGTGMGNGGPSEHNELYSTPIRLNGNATAPTGSTASLAGSTPSGTTPKPQPRKTKSPSTSRMLNAPVSLALTLPPAAASTSFGYVDAPSPPQSGVLKVNGVSPHLSGRLDAPNASFQSPSPSRLLRNQSPKPAPPPGLLLQTHTPSAHASGLLQAQQSPPQSGVSSTYQNGSFVNGLGGAQLGGAAAPPAAGPSSLSVSIPCMQTPRAQTPQQVQVPVVSTLQEGPFTLHAEPKFSSSNVRAHRPMYLQEMPTLERGPPQQQQQRGPPAAAQSSVAPVATTIAIATAPTRVALPLHLTTPLATHVSHPDAGYEARMNFFDDSDGEGDGGSDGGSTLDEENGAKMLTLGGHVALQAPAAPLVTPAPTFTQLGSSKGQQTTAKFNLTLFQNAANQPPAPSETPSSSGGGGIPRARAVGAQEVSNPDRVTYLQGPGGTPRTQRHTELQLTPTQAQAQSQALSRSQGPPMQRMTPFYTNMNAPRELTSPQMQPRASTTFPNSQTYWNMGVYGQTGLGHSLGGGGGWGGLGLAGRRPSTWDTGREYWSEYCDSAQPDFYKRHLYAEGSASYNPYVEPTAYNPYGRAAPYGGPPPPLSAAYVQYSQLNQVWDGRTENYPTPLTYYQHAPVTTAAPKSSSRSRKQSKTKASSRPTSSSRSRHGSEFTAPTSAQVYGGEGGRLLGPAPIPIPIGVEPSAYGPLMSPVPGQHGHINSNSRSRTRHTSDSAATAAAAAAGKGARRFGPESQMYLGPNVTMTIESVGHRNQQPHKTAASAQAAQAQLNIHNFTALDSKMYAPSASIPRAADPSLTPLQLPQQLNEAESQALSQHLPLAVTTPRLGYNVQQQPAAPAATPMQPVQVQMPPGNSGLLLQPAMATPGGPQVNGQIALSQQLRPNIQVQAAQLQPPPQQQHQVQAPVNAKNAKGKQKKEKEKKPKEKAKEKKSKEKEKPARVRGRPQELSLAPSTGNDDAFAD